MLILSVPTGSIATDELGNPIDATIPKPVRCYLKSKGTRKQIPTESGFDESALFLEGFCVEPMILPLEIQAKTIAQAQFGGMAGAFWLLAPINPPYGREGIGAISEATEGTKITGWFQEGAE
ncbi:hypothetical protein H6F43_00480 [Leptolyngbya sp. FACHB-36]|uniref:hypothetical protein n=1 Tax=Leptolyngbya sp. FACHB-36 TaxID=2692808 RepID=UPI00168100FF|nr:hypothetical protein [Leptolyngbya sp. FACHB-36]MBD2018659.1 hypothetical protein [Leptolyngbya sp. FACHB-36]